MHIGIFGISGSGKTTLSKLFLQAKPGYIGTSASSLIANSGNEISFKSLNQEKVSRNQETLVRAYKEFEVKNPNTIIELHNVIEIENGISWISPEVLLAINLDLVLFLKTAPDEILRRRISDKSKSRKIISSNELRQIQTLSLDNLISVFGAEKVHILSDNNSFQQLVALVDSTPSK